MLRCWPPMACRWRSNSSAPNGVKLAPPSWWRRWRYFLLATFILPIALLLYRSVENRKCRPCCPKPSARWPVGKARACPTKAALGVFVQELTAAKDNKAMVGNAAKRLNMEISGYRSLLTKTVRAMPLDPAAGPLCANNSSILTSAGPKPTTGACCVTTDSRYTRLLSAILAGHQARRRRQPAQPATTKRFI